MKTTLKIQESVSNSYEGFIKKSTGSKAYYFYPFLSIVKGKNVEEIDRSLVPISEIWSFYNGDKK